MNTDYHINMDSFGADCPANWEEIASFLNERIDAALDGKDDAFDPGYDASGLSFEGHAIVDSIWEDYCNGNIPDAPAPIMG